MKSLINKLPSNAYFDFLKEYWSDIEALFKSIQKFFLTVFKKQSTSAESAEEEE